MQQQKTSHWLIAFRVIFTAALLACILFIFRNSMQTGEVSSARSQAVTTLVNGFLGKFGLGPLSEHIIRKLAHFSEYALLGVLIGLAYRLQPWSWMKGKVALLPFFIIPVLDENLQRFSSGRSCELRDMLIDSAGMAAGMFLAIVLLGIIGHQKKQED